MGEDALSFPVVPGCMSAGILVQSVGMAPVLGMLPAVVGTQCLQVDSQPQEVGSLRPLLGRLSDPSVCMAGADHLGMLPLCLQEQ